MEADATGVTRRIARFIVQTDPTAIPAEAIEHAKVAFLDWFGVLMAGKDEPLTQKLIDYAQSVGGHPQATVLGHGLKTSAVLAALVNGSASHALDYDDTMSSFLGHPSVALFPALTALAEWQEKSGQDLLSAFTIALKAGATIGLCAGPDHYAAGWHGTSTIGRLGAAAGCAKLLGLDEQQTLFALGLAGTQAGGLKRVFGTMAKPFHAGKASQVGLESALLAGRDFTCVNDILEGHDGFFRALHGVANEQALASLGTTWEIESLAPKYHASCHATHSPIEAALAIARKENLSPSDIKSITLRSSESAIGIAGKTTPKTGLEGKFSIPYCVANALLNGDTTVPAFTDERVDAPDVREFMQKISLVPDPELAGLASRITVKTNDGRVYEGSYDVMSEIPDLEAKREKVKAKFRDLCAPVLGKKKTEELVKAFLSLETVENMRTLVESI